MKKVSRLQDAFGLFNRMMQTPGKAELTLTELRVRLIESIWPPLFAGMTLYRNALTASADAPSAACFTDACTSVQAL